MLLSKATGKASFLQEIIERYGYKNIKFVTSSNNILQEQKELCLNRHFGSIKNFNKIEEGKYQITWQETYTSTDGNFKENFLGIFTVETMPVTNQKMIQHNPLGIIITKLSISKTN